MVAGISSHETKIHIRHIASSRPVKIYAMLFEESLWFGGKFLVLGGADYKQQGS